MIKLKKKNLFVEINDDNFFLAVGEYDEDLNFKILHTETLSAFSLKNGKFTNLEASKDNLKKIINKIENKLNVLFTEVNVITNQTDLDCVNVSGFKKLNGNQILSEDITYILNDVKLKLIETEKHKTIIHLFNTKYLLDNKLVKNLPIGLRGDFYSHQLTFFLMMDKEMKNIKTLFQKSNLNINKIILKSFTEGIKIIQKNQKDTFLKIKINKEETQLIFFYESSFCFFQKFNFGSNMIFKDVSKMCSLEISKAKKIIADSDFNTQDEKVYVNKKHFDETSFRKISLQHILEISSARIEEMVNIIFNQNKNLNNLIDKNTPVFLYFDDQIVDSKFKNLFKSYFKKFKLNFLSSFNEDPFASLKIFGDLLGKGWLKEAIPITNKKRSWISRLFSGFFGALAPNMRQTKCRQARDLSVVKVSAFYDAWRPKR